MRPYQRPLATLDLVSPSRSRSGMPGPGCGLCARYPVVFYLHRMGCVPARPVLVYLSRVRLWVLCDNSGAICGTLQRRPFGENLISHCSLVLASTPGNLFEVSRGRIVEHQSVPRSLIRQLVEVLCTSSIFYGWMGWAMTSFILTSGVANSPVRGLAQWTIGASLQRMARRVSRNGSASNVPLWSPRAGSPVPPLPPVDVRGSRGPTFATSVCSDGAGLRNFRRRVCVLRAPGERRMPVLFFSRSLRRLGACGWLLPSGSEFALVGAACAGALAEWALCRSSGYALPFSWAKGLGAWRLG